MSDVNYDMLIIIGLDFGSSTTKVAYRIQSAEIDKSSVVRFPNRDSSGDGVLLDSVMYVSPDWKFFWPKRFDRSKRLPFFKSALINTVRNPVKNEYARELSALYLASIIASSRSYIEEVEERVLSDHNILWVISLGVPVDHTGINLHHIYEEIVHVAVVQYKLIPRLSLISRETWHKFYMESKYKELEDVHYHLVPELLAEVTDVFEDPEVEEGLSMVLDVGSATVDIAIVNLDRHSNETRYGVSFVSAKVGSIGVDTTVKYIESVKGQKCEGKVKKALYDPDGYAEMYRLMRESSFQIPDLDEYGDTLIKKFYGLFADTCLNVKKTSFKTKFSSMNSLPLYLLGGGHNYHWYQRWPSDAHTARLAQCNIPKGREQQLYNQMGLSSLDNSLQHRFRVASGLLKHETMLQVTGYPDHFKVNNPPMKRVSFHEKLEYRMAQLYGK